MRKLAAGIAAVVVLVLGACGGGSDNESSDGGDAVTIELIAFKPEKITVERGAKVTWTQKDATVHTVTSGTVAQTGGTVTESPDGKFDSSSLAQNKTFTFTFDEMGTFTYFCRIHPATMQGEVQVS